MSKVVVAWFEEGTSPRVVEALREAGFEGDDVVVRTDEDGTAFEELVALGVPETEAKHYAHQLADHGSVVTVRAPDEAAPDAVKILRRFGARDFRERLAEAPRLGKRTTRPGDDRDERAVVTERRSSRSGGW